jgi:perosamine synthetase
LDTVKYKEKIAAVLKCSPDQVFLYWKGRVALYAILKAMGVMEADEIIIPAFTCVVVPNAIFYLGAKPVYVDISAENYNIDIDKLREVVSPRTKVIICQNTFGLSSNIEQILEIAKQYNAFTIEDCTHGFSGFYNEKPNGSYCDAAFYSTQWNKPFSTGIGGFLVVNNTMLTDRVKNLENKKFKPTLIDNIVLAALLLSRRYLVNRYTHISLVRLYRFLSKNNLIIGSTQGDELSEVKIPKKYFKDISSIQVKKGLRELDLLDEVNKLRKKNASDYTQFLKANRKVYVSEEFFHNHLFLKYPILVKDRELFFEKARKQKVLLGDWFSSPLYPIKRNLHLWGFSPDKYPESTKISEKIVNLPTGIRNNITVMEFLTENIEMIE